MTTDQMQCLMDSLYKSGGSPDVVYMSIESAHENGLIGCFEYQVRRLIRLLRLRQPNIRWRVAQ